MHKIKSRKCVKSPVWEIFHIIPLIGRRMGYKYIKSLMPPQFPPQFPDTCPHSPFCILVRCPWYIFHGTSQPQGKSLKAEEIITMNWLAQNVVGYIPEIEEMNERAQELMQLQGIKTAGQAETENDK